MVRSKDKYSVSIDFPLDWEERIKAWAVHHGSVNQAINKAILEALLAWEGEETTRVRVARIDATVTELAQKFELLQSMGWAQLNALELTVSVSEKDWERVESLIARKE